jgi:methyl-accepting chemotaxis protein
MTFGRQLAAGFAIALFFVIAVGALAIRNTNALIDTSKLVAHSHAVLTASDALLLALVNAETGQRGYVITGNDSFLEPYRGAEAEAREAVAKLRELLRGDAAQTARLEKAWPLIAAKFDTNELRVETRRTKGAAAAQAQVASEKGLKTMQALRAALGDLTGEEHDRLERRAAEADALAAATRNAMAAGAALATLGMALVGFFTVRAVTNRVGAGVQSLRSSSFELQAVANQQAAGAGQQSTSMNEIAATMRELIASSRQIAEGARHVAAIATETAAAARAGEQAVADAQEAQATIRRHVDAIVGHMLELGRKTQQIGAVLEIIKELSDQTNIVAINATIEAMGAGEHGRRFAAVADELRKLADRVAESTKEIRPLVEEVRAAAGTTVMATEGGAKAVDEGTKQFLELATAFRQIVAQVAATNDAARTIELSTHQQATAVEQVHLAIGDAAQAARDAEASSQQTLQTATQLTGLSRELSALVKAEPVVAG